MKNYYLLFVLSVLCLGLFVRAETLYRKAVTLLPPLPGQTNSPSAVTNYLPVSVVVIHTNPPSVKIIGCIIPIGPTPAISWTRGTNTNVHVKWHLQSTTNLQTWVDYLTWTNGQSGFTITNFYTNVTEKFWRLTCNTNGL